MWDHTADCFASSAQANRYSKSLRRPSGNNLPADWNLGDLGDSGDLGDLEIIAEQTKPLKLIYL